MNKKLKKRLLLIIPLIVVISFICGISILNSKKSNISHSLKTEVEEPFIKVSNEIDLNKKTILNDNKYIRMYHESKRIRFFDDIVSEYASYFNLDTNKVVEVARRVSNNYRSTSFINNNSIGSEDGTFTSKEAGIVYFVRYLYRNPEKYGSTAQEIGKNNRIVTEKVRENDHIRLNSGMTYEQFLDKICNLYGINKVLALAIVYEESGIMTSSLFNNSNNMGGLRASGSSWLSFPSLEAGTICYVFTLKNLLGRYNIDSFDKNRIYYFSGIYVHGNINDPAEHWTGNVTRYMKQIEDNNVFE